MSKGNAMEIQITDDYVMTSDPHNFILNEVGVGKTGKNAGNVRLNAVAYYPCISDLCTGLVDRKLRSSTATTIEALVAEHNALCEKIEDIFKKEWMHEEVRRCSKCKNYAGKGR